MKTVKVFRSGNSQAIRIPKEYAISDSELLIHKVGSSIILTSKDDLWSSFRNSINMFSDDLFSEGREQPEMQERESL
mgnify:CR=1 FL=1